jgi:hypothetical protein
MRSRFGQSVREQAQGRLAAAIVNGGAQAAEPRGNGTYTIRGRAGDRYTCRVISLDVVQCDCKAAISRGSNACWHSAAAWLRAVADRTLEVAA